MIYYLYITKATNSALLNIKTPISYIYSSLKYLIHLILNNKLNFHNTLIQKLHQSFILPTKNPHNRLPEKKKLLLIRIKCSIHHLRHRGIASLAQRRCAYNSIITL